MAVCRGGGRERESERKREGEREAFTNKGSEKTKFFPTVFNPPSLPITDVGAVYGSAKAGVDIVPLGIERAAH